LENTTPDNVIKQEGEREEEVSVGSNSSNTTETIPTEAKPIDL